MALSATFTANFQSFYDAVDKAEVKLKDFGVDADKVGGRLSKMADSFSGRKIIEEASLMVKAIGDIENVSKLTDKELARLGATTNEAVAKMKLLGKDVPKDLQAVADATKNANKQSIDWAGTLGKLAATMGVAFSVGQIKDFIGSVFDAAGAIQDLSDQWGVSTQAVQQFTAAASLSGVEAKSVGKSLQFLTTSLASSSNEYDALLKNVGLSAEKLRTMPLEDAYREIINVIAGIKDESLQLDVALALLGPDAKKMIGAIRDGFVDAAAAQKFMSDETIARLAAAGDAWTRFKNLVVIHSGEMLATVMANTETMTSSWGNFFGFMLAEMRRPGQGGGAWLAEQKAAADKASAAIKAHTAATKTATATTNIFGGEVLNTALVLANQKKAEDASKASTAARAKALADAKRDNDAYNKSIADQAKRIDDLAASLNGADLVDKANDYLVALQKSIPVQNMTAAAQASINKVMADAIDVYVAAGAIIPKALLDTWVATKIASDNVVTFTLSLEELKRRYLDLTQLPKFDPLSVGTSVDLPDAPADPDRVPKMLQDVRLLSQEFINLGQIVGGSFGDVLTATGEIGLAFDDARVSGKLLKTGIEDFQKGNTTSGLITVSTAALQVASSFLAATEGAGMMQSILTGASMGASLGMTFTAIGAGVGAIAGGLVGIYRGFANLQENKKNLANLKLEMIGAIPVWADMTKYASEFNDVLEADSMSEARLRFEALSDALEADEWRSAFIDAAGGVDMLRRAAELAGFDIEKVFSLEGDRLKAELDALTEAFRFQNESMETLNETAERYGFTLEELGPALQRQRLDEQAQQLYKDWQVLNAAGIDTVAITDRMGESVSDYVNQALKMGTEIPEAMRPMLQAMADSGDLLNENGDAMTDLEASGVTFAMTMSDGFKRLIDVVEKLTDSISRSLGLAIKNVPAVEVEGRVTWRVDDVPASNAGEKLEGYARGTDGYRNFGTGTPVMLHGWEAVVPKDDPGSFATVGGGAAPLLAPAGAAPTSIVINAQGAFFDTPGDLQRLADRVDAALSARHGLSNKRRAG